MMNKTLSLLATAVFLAYAHPAWSAGPPRDTYYEEDTAEIIEEAPVKAAPVQSVVEAPKSVPVAPLNNTANTAPMALQAARVNIPHVNLWERVRYGFGMPSLNNLLVQKHIQSYTSKPEYLGRIFNRGQKYLHYIVEQVEKRNMPMELALLPVVESAFNPHAYSHAAAAGLWQFIPSTGTQYGLEQTMWYDGRRDVIAATDAALNYLDKLHTQFGDWQLALAAYNWGEGAVQNAINKNLNAGLPTDYNTLSMPLETRNYVPKLMAIRAIVEHPELYGVELPAIKNEPYFTTVSTKKHMDVKIAAQLANMDEAEFLSLNPAYKLPVIAYKESRKLIVPINKAPLFSMNLSNYNQPLLSWYPYVTENKESVSTIAKRYQITPEELKQANAISGNWVAAGKVLLVPRLAGQEVGDDMRLRTAAAPETTTALSTTPVTVDSSNTVAPVTSAPANLPVVPTITAAEDTPVEPQVALLPTTQEVRQETTLNTMPSVTVAGAEVPSTKAPTMAAPEPVAATSTQALAPRAILSAKEELPTAKPQSAQSTPIELPVKVVTEEELNALRPAPKTQASYALDVPTKSTTTSPKSIPQTKPSNRPSYYTVKRGDTLSSIAAEFNTSIAAIKAQNKLKQDVAPLGVRLRIPAEGAAFVPPVVAQSAPANKPNNNTRNVRYKVKRGDTLISIAQAHNTSVEEIKALNKLRGDVAPLGATLKITASNQALLAQNEKPATEVTKKQSRTKKAAEPVVHEVKRGDSLAKIAEAHGLEVDELKAANKIRKDTIVLGDELLIPKSKTATKETSKPTQSRSKKSKKQSYIVKAGDTLIGIAKRFDIDADALSQANGKTSRNLRPGTRLSIPVFD